MKRINGNDRILLLTNSIVLVITGLFFIVSCSTSDDIQEDVIESINDDEEPFKRLLIEDGDSAGLVIDLYSSKKTAVVAEHRSSLKSNVVIPRQITDEGTVYSIKKIGNMAFTWCFDMESITIPEGVVEIGSSAFFGAGLRNVKLPESLVEIGTGAFAATSLSSIKIPSGVTKIKSRVFSDCKISNIAIPDNVIEICDSAFWYSGLQTITIGKGVKHIGYNAFLNCDRLKSITIKSETPPVINPVDSPFEVRLQSTCTLYVPKGCVEKYQRADVWKNFVSIVEMY